MIGVAAALAATVGDLLLLATSNAGRPGFEWLPAPSGALLLVGTYLGVMAIPCYGLGFREVAACFETRLRRPLIVWGTIGGVLGGTTHGLTGLVIDVERARTGAGGDPLAVLAPFAAYLTPLWCAIAVASAVGSAIYVAGVVGGRSTLPRWMALANPALLALVLAGLGASTVVGQAFLVPAAPNVAQLAFFTLVAATGRGR